MDPRLAIAMAAVATSNATLGAEAARSQNVLTKQYAYAALAQGGGFPEWLPTAPSGDRPLIYADFVNGNYWGGGAITTLTDLCHENTDWGAFDPASVVPGSGLNFSNGDGSPVFNPAYLGAVLSTSTIVFQATTINSAFGPIQVDIMALPTFAVDAQTKVQAFSAAAYEVTFFSLAGNAGNNGLLSVIPPIASVAYTTYANHTICSSNGSVTASTATGTIGAVATDIGITEQSGHVGLFMQTIAIYAPQPDGDLPTLSTP